MPAGKELRRLLLSLDLHDRHRCVSFSRMTNPNALAPIPCMISTCPSCASQSASALELDADAWVVSCSKFGLVGPIAEDQAQAIASWNLRLTLAKDPGSVPRALQNI